jgi:hypothetical protein
MQSCAEAGQARWRGRMVTNVAMSGNGTVQASEIDANSTGTSII